jgi:small subunit ribosomal protein S10e
MHLFKEGTLVAKKDFYQPIHSEALPINNLEVLCLMRSLRSKGFVTETFSWRYYYYVLTPEGIEYLRKYLALPAEVVPSTVARAVVRKPVERSERPKREAGGDFKPEYQKRERREGYRS